MIGKTKHKYRHLHVVGHLNTLKKLAVTLLILNLDELPSSEVIFNFSCVNLIILPV